jgi:hypothetical protein
MQEYSTQTNLARGKISDNNKLLDNKHTTPPLSPTLYYTTPLKLSKINNLPHNTRKREPIDAVPKTSIWFEGAWRQTPCESFHIVVQKSHSL